MNIGIGLILKLPRHEPAMRLGKLDGLVDHADRPLGGGSYNDLRSKEPHELAPLYAKRLCHGDYKRISLGCANHGKRNPRISACRLDDRLGGFKLSRFFSRFDDPESQSVLH